MAACRSLLVQAGKQRVLTLPALNPCYGFCRFLFEVCALVPNSGQRMISAFSDRPYHNCHRTAGALDIQRRIVQALAWNEKKRTKVRVSLGLDPDRVTKGTGTERWEVSVACDGAGVPEVSHVIARIKGIIIRRACGDMRRVALAGPLSFGEVPKSDKPWYVCYDLNTFLTLIASEKRECHWEKNDKEKDHGTTHRRSCAWTA